MLTLMPFASRNGIKAYTFFMFESHRHQFHLRHGVAQSKRLEFVDPLGQGFQMGQDAVDGPVAVTSPALCRLLFFQMIGKGL